MNEELPLSKAAVKHVGPLLLWMILIFAFSTDAAAAEKTQPAVGGLLRRLCPGLARRLSARMLERIDWNIRKTFHIGEYAVLAILAYRAVAFGRASFSERQVILPFLLGVLYAASDEYHQSFYPSRRGTAADVTFDTFGVTLGLVLCLWHRAVRTAGTTVVAKQEDRDGTGSGAG
jgi:VanZ family protein